MQIPDGRAHLIVRIRADVFHQKVDEARIALQNAKNLQRPIGGLRDAGGGRGLGGWWGFLTWRKTKLLRDVERQFAAK